MNTTPMGRARMRTDDWGFTLIELLLSALILPIVLSAGYLVFTTMSGSYSSISAQSEATSEAQRAMDTMVREIRQAREIADGAGAFKSTEERRCSFYADLDRDGTPERITYYVDGTDLYRALAKPTIPAYPYDYVDGPAQRVVNLSTSSAVVFTYYDKSNPIQKVIGSPNPSTVVAVGIDLSASRAAQNGQVSVGFRTRVKVRALFNSLS
jgi:prepilin-type N-terminal cleavage/methylation domain-containing protein